jgi:hypothetical protein
MRGSNIQNLSLSSYHLFFAQFNLFFLKTISVALEIDTFTDQAENMTGATYLGCKVSWEKPTGYIGACLSGPAILL